MPVTNKLREALSRALRKNGAEKRFGRNVQRCLADPFFPTAFFLRNVMTLRNEKNFRRLPLRVQKGLITRMLRERSAIFLEVKEWLAKDAQRQGSLEAASREPEPARLDAYCNRCGWCCEIASGMPVFPEDSAVPEKWKRIFGDGLGRGHRFCAFLWVSGEAGGSLCSIHPWRSIPCRTFERDECEFLQGEPDFADPAVPTRLVDAGRWLIDLVDGR